MSSTTTDADPRRFNECPKCGGYVQTRGEAYLGVKITHWRCTECSWRTSGREQW